MVREMIEKYYESYSNGDFETVAKHYSDDIIFEYQGVTLRDQKAVFDWFGELLKDIKEEFKAVNIIIEGDKIAVELEDRIEAKTDIPNLLNKSIELKKANQ